MKTLKSKITVTSKPLANGKPIYTATYELQGNKWFGVGMSKNQAIAHAIAAASELGQYVK